MFFLITNLHLWLLYLITFSIKVKVLFTIVFQWYFQYTFLYYSKTIKHFNPFVGDLVEELLPFIKM